MKRKRTPYIAKLVIEAAKDIRKKKLEFEREASRQLSEALGFDVTVKIKRKLPTDGMPATMKRASRMSPKKVDEMLYNQILDLTTDETVPDL